MKSWFRGRFEIRVDDKGRFRMPSLLRNTHNKSNHVIITNGLFNSQHCLDLYTTAAWQSLEERISKLPKLHKDVQLFQRFYLSGAVETEYDSQGRLLLPPNLKKYSGIDTNAVLVGMGEKLEIWSKSQWDKLHESLAGQFEESLQAVARLESSLEEE